MAVLPFQPTPFFANKNRAFWMLQLAGWVGVLFYRSVSAIANQAEFDFDFLLIIAISTLAGFSISLLLAVIYRMLIDRAPFVTWTVTMLVLVIGVAIYAAIDAWTIGLYYPDRETSFIQRLFSYTYLNSTLLGAWSALYYAINFFLQIEEQADRLQRLEAQATSAQLAMLRYQLNPHFLFNTLNSISTLVLLKQSDPANAMLTRLSSFLRHTLETEPGAQVTLAQEIETLQLYLSIERMRFEDRLQMQFAVEPEAAKACLPSMLLQPLVENAIKYAVSPQEEGATITISAQRDDKRLRIQVADTGPGLPGYDSAKGLPNSAMRPATAKREPASTGVGLANIRDRLIQAYGDDQLFTITAPGEGGFTVSIDIPYTAAETESEDRQRGAERFAAPELPLPAPAGGAKAAPA